MGGDDVIISDRHLHGVRRPRHRPQRRIGERALLHRSPVPSPLSEASISLSHWSGGVDGGGGGTILSGRAELGRARRGNSAVGHAVMASPAADAGVDAAHETTASCDETAATLDAQNIQPSPSPPRTRSSQQVPAGAAVISEHSSASSSPSPVRRLRTIRPRSPTSKSAAFVEAPQPQARRGSETADSPGIGDDAVDAVGGTSRMNHRERSKQKSSQGKRFARFCLSVSLRHESGCCPRP